MSKLNSIFAQILPKRGQVTGTAAGSSHTAVLVIDVQSCFAEGGALAVPGANAAYVSDVQRATKRLHQKGYLVVGSRDYHPANHISFAINHPGHNPFNVITLPDGRIQVLWPAHCVQTAGDSRELVDNNLFFELVKKGQNPQYDSYSTFKDDGGAETELDAILKAGPRHQTPDCLRPGHRLLREILGHGCSGAGLLGHCGRGPFAGCGAGYLRRCDCGKGHHWLGITRKVF